MFKTLVIFLIIMTSLGAQATKRSCSSMLSSQYGQIRYTFDHSKNYDVEILPIRIKNQCATGHCHLYAWASELESRSGIKVSMAFLDAIDLHHKSLLSLKELKTDISQGAFSQDSRLNIRRMGLVPDGMWPGRKDFTQDNNYSKLLAGLEAIVTNAHWQIKQEKADKKIILTQAQRHITDLIQAMAGPLSFEFTYEGRKYNPKSFAEKYFPELDKPIMEVEIVRYTDEVTVDKTSAEGVKVYKIAMPWEKAENLMAKVIDSGRPVYLAYNHEKQYVDSKTGIMSISAFHFPQMATILDRSTISQYYKWSGSHAVLVVGYQRNPETGLIEKWKIQNSWGEKAGDKGYFHMYRDYLHLYGWAFSFINDGSIKEF